MNKENINKEDLYHVYYYSIIIVKMINRFYEVNPKEMLTQRDYENIHRVALQEVKKKNITDIKHKRG